MLPGWHKCAGGNTAPTVEQSKWPALIHAVESELCRLNDLVEPDGSARDAFCGRGKLVHTAQRLALPRRTSSALGKVCISAHALIWLGRRVKELAAISSKIAGGQVITAGASCQWRNIICKLSSVSGLIKFVEKLGPEWRDRVEMVRNHVLGRDPQLLHAVVGMAFATAADMKAKHLEQRSESWRSFVAKQVATGAAVAHRLVKRDSYPMPGACHMRKGSAAHGVGASYRATGLVCLATNMASTG